ncbi:YlmH/Sll1252 family protein [Wukongibacter baidiensis]|uniref:YlmH family RNA-binding protein n=1 Tax=Wukongibacter baidiensis TaxID=1723361 RepID=UPI003D7FE05B
MDRKGIARRYSLSDKYEIELLKVLDKLEIAVERNIFKYTDFLDPYIATICTEILKRDYEYVQFDTTGGFEDAERKVVIIYPDYLDKDDENIPIKVIKIEDLPKGKKISHREVLGSVLGLGLKREKIGDIIISEDMIQILALEEVARFIELNLTQIGKYNITAYLDHLENIIPKDNEFKIITDTVKSLRLDAISSSGFSESRSKATVDIRKEKVKVNHVPICSPSYNIKEGDVISYRGKGRIILDKVLGKTKKDRLRISIKKFI